MPDENGNYTEEELKNMSPEELLALQKQNCVFCRIAKSQMPSAMVYEDDLVACFLDINPASKGHVLIVPKEHHLILPQIPAATQRALFIAAQHMSQAAFKALQVDGTTLFIANGGAAGQRAYHFILHIIPRDSKDGLFASKPKELPAAQLAELRKTLIANLGRVLKGNKIGPTVFAAQPPGPAQASAPRQVSSPAQAAQQPQAVDSPVPSAQPQQMPIKLKSPETQTVLSPIQVPRSPLLPASMRAAATRIAQPLQAPAPDEEDDDDGGVKASDDDDPEDDADVEHPMPHAARKPSPQPAPRPPPATTPPASKRSSATNPALDGIANLFLGGGR